MSKTFFLLLFKLEYLHLVCLLFFWGSLANLTLKCSTWKVSLVNIGQARKTSNWQSNLIVPNIIDEEKKFYNIGPWSPQKTMYHLLPNNNSSSSNNNNSNYSYNTKRVIITTITNVTIITQVSV